MIAAMSASGGGNRAARDVPDDVGFHGQHHVAACDPAGSRPRDAPRVQLHGHPAVVRPPDVALGLAVAQPVPVVEDELALVDALALGSVEVLLGHAGNQQHRACVHLHPGGTHPAGGVLGRYRDAQHQFRGERVESEPRDVEFARGDHRRGAAVQVVVDPPHRILCRRPLPEGGVDVPVDQTGHHGQPARGQHQIRRGVIGADPGDDAVLDDQRGIPDRRRRGVAVHQQADVLHEQRSHRSLLCLDFV